MLKRITTVLVLFVFLGCSKNASENKMLIGGPWTITVYNGNPINQGQGLYMTFYKSKNTQGAATFNEADTLFTGIYKRTALYHYAVANNGTELKFTPQDSARLIFGKGSGVWHIDDISSNSLKLTFEDDTTHATWMQMQR